MLVHADHLYIFVAFVTIITHVEVNPIVKFVVTNIFFKIYSFKFVVQPPEPINVIQIRRGIQKRGCLITKPDLVAGKV